ncbi:uncharacterized protein BCR38DRAFT_490566 [Pseudomassariella vexata]|uniref:DUF7905 domain-containing protein n=1 Tax=Pseudomassariella vexata TaxID=1141098 RepID=A0A1Y2DBP4_9PEZI|nr:uncharacterized protein BCR38DRAFT_490566 [Pseudomassariella vexata]ORY56682.1 hypothetical protein BCR38DRAFT_490566 [Pseudomassariella vexata]
MDDLAHFYGAPASAAASSATMKPTTASTPKNAKAIDALHFDQIDQMGESVKNQVASKASSKQSSTGQSSSGFNIGPQAGGHTELTVTGHSSWAYRSRRSITWPAEPITQQWNEYRTQGRKLQAKPIDAVFTLSHYPALTEGVVTAIHKELARRLPKKVMLRVEGQAPYEYLYISADSGSVVIDGIRMARSLADELIADKTIKTCEMFAEPPAFLNEFCRIVLDINASGPGHPRLLQHGNQDLPDPQRLADHQTKFLDDFCLRLSAALKRVGRLDSGTELRVKFGRFVLQTYPKVPDGGYTFDRFSSVLQDPRATGKLQSQFSGMEKALRVLGTFKREGSAFGSTVFADPDPSLVRPDFLLEAFSRGHKFEAALQSPAAASLPGETITFKMPLIEAFKVDASDRKLDIITVTPGRNFDWKIETVDKAAVTEKSFNAIEKYLKSATVAMSKENQVVDINKDYPRIRLEHRNPIAYQFDKVAIKSVFRFEFTGTLYIVDFTIRREWKSMRAMTEGEVEPAVTFSITVYGGHWDDSMRASNLGLGGRGWGEELQVLLPSDGQGLSPPDAKGRVRAFVGVIHAIRDALELALDSPHESA